MIETFIALLCGHILADFAFQTGKMARGKAQGHQATLALHIGIVALATVATTGTLHPAILAVVIAHLAIDLFKNLLSTRLKSALKPFLIDQALHILSLYVIAEIADDIWTQSIWNGYDQMLVAQIFVAGGIATVWAGGFAVKMVLDDLEAPPPGDNTEALLKGGEVIGRLERGLIFLLILIGQPAGVGFLIAAKSILRFETSKSESDPRSVSEYIIIGTLASFGWAIAMSWATLALLGVIGLGNSTPNP